MAGEVDPRTLAEVDRANRAWLAGVIGSDGWPGASRVGADAARVAWLLAQHADEDPAFQRRCLDLLTEAVGRGEATARELAYLTDRVLLKEQGRQVYGTQMALVAGETVADRLDDPDGVDARRAAVGLEPLAQYLSRAAERRRRDGTPFSRARIRCRGCNRWIQVLDFEAGERRSVPCEACGAKTEFTAPRVRHVQDGGS